MIAKGYIFKWGPEEQAAFEKIGQVFMEDIVLACPELIKYFSSINITDTLSLSQS